VLIQLSLLSAGAAVVARFLTPDVLSPGLLPLWIGGAVVFGLWGLALKGPTAAALPYLAVVPATFAVAALVSLATGPVASRLLLLLVSLTLTALLVYAIAEHAVRWLLATPGLSGRDVERYSELWSMALDHDAIQRETETSRANAREHETRLLKAMAQAPYGLIVLALVALVAVSPAASVVLALVTWSAAALVVLLPADAPDPRHALRSVGVALASFLAYGRRGENAPGVFQSPTGPLVYRLALTALVFALLASSITPPVLALPSGGSMLGGATPIVVLLVGWVLFELLSRLVPAIPPVPRAAMTVVVVAVVFTPSAILSELSPRVLSLFVLKSAVYALLPLLILTSTTFAVLGRLLPALNRALRIRPPRVGKPRATDSESWEAVVSRLRTSSRRELREELLIGFHATEGYPVLLPAKTIQEHAHLLGASGGGKTSRGVVPLAAQLIRTTGDDLDSNIRGAVVVVDLKGTDTAAFHALREEAERAGRTFRFFTNRPGATSHAFNPLLELYELGFSRGQICDILRAAMNVEHGTGYGMGHFSAVGHTWLSELIEKRPQARSIADLMRNRPVATGRTGRKLEENATEIISALERLARRPELNITELNAPTAELFSERISLARALREGHVLYFALGSAFEETAARLMGSLAVECLYVAATLFTEQNEGRAPTRAYLFVDEFQIVAGRNFQRFLEQARGAGLHFVLSNQARESLEEDLRAAVDESTNYRQFFTARSPEAQEYLKSLSGETLEDLSFGAEVPHLALGPRLRPNDILELSSAEHFSLTVQGMNRGVSRFGGHLVPVRSPHHVSEATYRRLSNMPWPSLSPALLTIGSELPHPKVQSAAPGPRRLPTPPTDTPLAEMFARIVRTRDGYAVSERSTEDT
jgi:hypothetical protein